MPERFNAKDALADYVTVPQRIAQFYELFGTGRLVTGEVRVEMGPDGKSRVMVQAAAYRTPDDPLPGIGWSWMELPGTTSFTRGSELENTETSAWGRAIAALGILVDRSVASANEVKIKSGEKAETTREPIVSKDPKLLGPASFSGSILVRKTGASDGMMRQGPDGVYFIVAFRTTDQTILPQVHVKGALASDLYDAAGGVLNGLDATISGDLYEVPFTNGDFSRPFQRLELHRIETKSWSLPVPEPPTIPMFSEADESELDAALIP
jgi:hypothetical protein